MPVLAPLIPDYTSLLFLGGRRRRRKKRGGQSETCDPWQSLRSIRVQFEDGRSGPSHALFPAQVHTRRDIEEEIRWRSQPIVTATEIKLSDRVSRRRCVTTLRMLQKVNEWAVRDKNTSTDRQIGSTS